MGRHPSQKSGKSIAGSTRRISSASCLPNSSQIAASLAATEGRDFVVVGPPGTGKSQTIANMIANCLAGGKTVLFVAEKTAALDVVYRRLREHSLGDYCLELHSSKADRKSFVSQLKQAWQASTRSDDCEWIQVNERLRLRRDELNSYVDSLHKRHPNGLTAYKAIGVASKGAEQHSPKFSFASPNATTRMPTITWRCSRPNSVGSTALFIVSRPLTSWTRRNGRPAGRSS